jgi:hypothetical protein
VTHTWTWTTDGKPYSDDNPLILADRKAKRLASLLRRLPAVQKSRARLPFIRPGVFLSAAGLVCKLSGTAAAGVYPYCEKSRAARWPSSTQRL